MIEFAGGISTSMVLVSPGSSSTRVGVSLALVCDDRLLSVVREKVKIETGEAAGLDVEERGIGRIAHLDDEGLLRGGGGGVVAVCHHDRRQADLQAGTPVAPFDIRGGILRETVSNAEKQGEERGAESGRHGGMINTWGCSRQIFSSQKAGSL